MHFSSFLKRVLKDFSKHSQTINLWSVGIRPQTPSQADHINRQTPRTEIVAPPVTYLRNPIVQQY